MYKYSYGILLLSIIMVIKRISTDDLRNCSTLDKKKLHQFIRKVDKSGVSPAPLRHPDKNETFVKLENGSVYINVKIVDLYNLDEQQSSVQAMLEVNIKWKPLSTRLECRLQEKLVFHEDEFKIWKPMFSLYGVRQAQVMESPDNTDQIVLFPGDVYVWSVQLSVTLACFMDFTFFPFDNMTCLFWLNPKSSTSYHEQWDGIEMLRALPTLRSHWVTNIKPWYFVPPMKQFPSYRNYTIAICHVLLKRYFTFHILSGYLPNFLVLFGVWLGFLLDPAVAHVRMTMGLTGLAVLFIQYGNMNANMAKVGYMRTIDIWMFFSASMVLGALIEFSLICYIKRVAQYQHKQKRSAGVAKRCAKWDRIGMIGYAAAVVLVSSSIILTNVIGPYYFGGAIKW